MSPSEALQGLSEVLLDYPEECSSDPPLPPEPLKQGHPTYHAVLDLLGHVYEAPIYEHMPRELRNAWYRLLRFSRGKKGFQAVSDARTHFLSVARRHLANMPNPDRRLEHPKPKEVFGFAPDIARDLVRQGILAGHRLKAYIIRTAHRDRLKGPRGASIGSEPVATSSMVDEWRDGLLWFGAIYYHGTIEARMAFERLASFLGRNRNNWTIEVASRLRAQERPTIGYDRYTWFDAPAGYVVQYGLKDLDLLIPTLNPVQREIADSIPKPVDSCEEIEDLFHASLFVLDQMVLDQNEARAIAVPTGNGGISIGGSGGPAFVTMPIEGYAARLAGARDAGFGAGFLATTDLATADNLVKGESAAARRRMGPKPTREELNIKACDYLRKHAKREDTNKPVTARELAESIGCGQGTISSLPVWKALMEEREKRGTAKGPRARRRPKTVALSQDVLATHGKDDAELARLIGEQARDMKADNRRRRKQPNRSDRED